MTKEAVKKKNLETIIELKNLVKVFGKQTVVDDINLKIKKGEFVTLLGPSGCGKTTILRMIAGFEMPSDGIIYLEGTDVTKIPPHKRNVNTVFQKYALFPHLDVFNNIAYGLKLKTNPRLSKAEIKQRVDEKLKLVGLAEYGHRDIDSLSGGQQQRVAIARALVMEPRVLLLDEPLGALDLKMRKEMQLELRRMHREIGITFIYVTHDQEEALTMSDTIVVINDGLIQQVGTPKQIYDKPVNAFVANFIGESNILGGTMLEDHKVKFLGQTFRCDGKGFCKNQPVDIVIRPEDITILSVTDKNAELKGTVISSTFMGTYYEKAVLANDYEFTIQSVDEVKEGTEVGLTIKPGDIHIMSMETTINEYETYMTGEDTLEISGVYFQTAHAIEKTETGDEPFKKGDPVTARIAFNHVEIVDDENDGTIGGYVTQSIYKGSYYNVNVWTDNDTLFIVNTPYEWDTDDRVGLIIKPENIIVERREETEEE
ncbi:MAG: ABC transporter ATP-binding protein [Firmicutes bacterium]|nr:ABC transporter ATP-binding protein [Bacillota bacterium]